MATPVNDLVSEARSKLVFVLFGTPRLSSARPWDRVTR
jgi:hypothetical protein